MGKRYTNFRTCPGNQPEDAGHVSTIIFFSLEEFEGMARRAGFEITEVYRDYDYAKFIGQKTSSMIWKSRSTYR